MSRDNHDPRNPKYMDDVLSANVHNKYPGGPRDTPNYGRTQARRHSKNSTIAAFLRPSDLFAMRILYSTVAIVLLILLFVFTKPIFVDTVSPESPFSTSVAQSVSIPLYFPTELPEGYIFSKDNVRKPDNNVIIYAITNSEGSTINISLQPIDLNLNLESVFETYTDLRDIKISIGEGKAGFTEDGQLIAHIFTDKTWIIVHTDKNNMVIEQFDLILRGLTKDS